MTGTHHNQPVAPPSASWALSSPLSACDSQRTRPHRRSWSKERRAADVERFAAERREGSCEPSQQATGKLSVPARTWRNSSLPFSPTVAYCASTSDRRRCCFHTGVRPRPHDRFALLGGRSGSEQLFAPIGFAAGQATRARSERTAGAGLFPPFSVPPFQRSSLLLFPSGSAKNDK